MGELRCSFCNRSQKETRAMVDGPRVRICNECVNLCAALISEEDREQVGAESFRTSVAETARNLDAPAIDREIAKLLPLVHADPGDVSSLLRLGDLFEWKGQSQVAAEHYGRVAAIYQRDGAPHQAIAVYKKMLDLAVAPKGINYRIGELYEKLGLPLDANAHYEAEALICESAGDPGMATALRDRTRVLAQRAAVGKAQNVLIGNVLTCSFCKKQQRAVKKLIAGPNVYVCNECVAVCVDTITKG